MILMTRSLSLSLSLFPALSLSLAFSLYIYISLSLSLSSYHHIIISSYHHINYHHIVCEREEGEEREREREGDRQKDTERERERQRRDVRNLPFWTLLKLASRLIPLDFGKLFPNCKFVLKPQQTGFVGSLVRSGFGWLNWHVIYAGVLGFEYAHCGLNSI